MIKINNLELQEVSCTYSGSTLQLEFDIQNMTLQELEEYFSLNTDATIEQFSNDTLVNKWYYKEFQSIGYEKAGMGWHIKLVLEAIPISVTDLNDIYTLIQEKEDALLELASLIDTNDTNIETINSKIETINSKIQELKTTMTERFASLQNTLYRLDNNYNRLNDRIAQLENKSAGQGE